jgi:NurA-like 5'-3' nuclease
LILIRFLIGRKKDISVDFFVIALRNENNGYFEEAVASYEKALTEATKSRFHTILKNKIIEKLKVLHTVIEYKNNLRFVRQGF